MVSRTILAVLVTAACVLPVAIAIVLGVGRLLAAMQDAAGAAVLDRDCPGDRHFVGDRPGLPAGGPRHQFAWSAARIPRRGRSGRRQLPDGGHAGVSCSDSQQMSVSGKPRMKSLPNACEAVEKPRGTSSASVFCSAATAVSAVSL